MPSYNTQRFQQGSLLGMAGKSDAENLETEESTIEMKRHRKHRSIRIHTSNLSTSRNAARLGNGPGQSARTTKTMSGMNSSLVKNTREPKSTPQPKAFNTGLNNRA